MSGRAPAPAAGEADAPRKEEREGSSLDAEEMSREQIILRAVSKHLLPGETITLPSGEKIVISSPKSAKGSPKPVSKTSKTSKPKAWIDVSDKGMAKKDEEALRKQSQKLVDMVTSLGTFERLAEANRLSDAKSVEEAVKQALDSAAADQISDIVAEAKNVLSSEEAGRALRHRGADMLIGIERYISDTKNIDAIGSLADKGIENLTTLAEKGDITKNGDTILKSAQQVLNDLGEGKGLSSDELKRWTSYVTSSDMDKDDKLHEDPNLAAILEKANTILTSKETVEFLKSQKDGLQTGASSIISTAEGFMKDKKSQGILKSWAASGLNLLRTATADKVYTINQGFKFHVRSEPTTSGAKKNGIILRSGDVFTVSEVRKLPDGSQTYLKLADGRGWVFTDHPNPKDNRKLISEVQLALEDTDESSSVGTNDEEGEESEAAKQRKAAKAEKKMIRAQRRFQHRGKQLLDLTGKRYLGKGADDLLTHGSRIYEDKEARDAFLKEIKDASVEFLLSYLPTMKIEPIEGEKDGVKYKLWDIDLSGFKIVSEHVSVTFDEKRMELMVVATKLSCKMKKLGWRYKQLKFPYLSGEGVANATTRDAKFLFVVGIEFITKEEANRRKKEMEEREKKRKEEDMQRNKIAGFKTSSNTITLSKAIAGQGENGGTSDKKDDDFVIVDEEKETPAFGTSNNTLETSALKNNAEEDGAQSAVPTDEKKGGNDGLAEGEEKLILQVTLKKKKMIIRDLDLAFDTGGGMTNWFYNKVASIFKDTIRIYVEAHLNTSLESYSYLIVDLCNTYAQQYYLTLLNIVKAAQKGAEDSKQGKARKSEQKIEQTEVDANKKDPLKTDGKHCTLEL